MQDLPLEHVQDYPRPPRLETVPHRLRIVLNDSVIAETLAGFRVLETHHAPTYYFPPSDVSPGVLEVADGSSWCEWKGAARYWSVSVGDVIRRRAAWSYPQPTESFKPLAGYLAFYAEQMDACFVGEHRVRPQPGSFYGGWVTDNLTGKIKGAPGTEHW